MNSFQILLLALVTEEKLKIKLEIKKIVYSIMHVICLDENVAGFVYKNIHLFIETNYLNF